MIDPATKDNLIMAAAAIVIAIVLSLAIGYGLAVLGERCEPEQEITT